MKRIALAATLVVFATACDNYPALRIRDAVRDAQRALVVGDCRLVGVYGLTIETPGAPYEEKIRRGVRVIEGTSDTPGSGAEVRFNERARKYAERYNLEILAYCPSPPRAM